jgi:16S rRNA (cytosine967-C5)-methyltransferase
MAFDARRTALTILNTLDQGQQTLDSILDVFPIDATQSSRRDRALLQALIYGVLRWKGRLDYMISYFSHRPLNKIDPTILNILRLALFQIIYLDRIPESAAVNTSVEMAKISGPRWVAGYVNALLRKAVREYQKVPFPEVEENTVAALASAYSFPEWILSRWLSRFGRNTTEALCAAVNTIPPITVRTNRLKTSPQKLLTALEDEVDLIRPTHYSPDGITFFNPKNSIPRLHAFKSGWFQVQDEAAQLISLLLDPQAGERVLDACAGLGGKTGHIGQLMKNEGTIIAIDNDRRKLLKLESEMQRLGISIVSGVCRNLADPYPQQGLNSFDRILLDAPCSGLGIMRRHPDIKWRNSKKNLARFGKKQIELLENLSRHVKPSGVLVYAVCSLEPEENEAVINEFLKNHKEFVIDKNFGKLPEKIGTMVASQGFIRTFPHLHQMDGFFSVRFRRMS